MFLVFMNKEYIVRIAWMVLVNIYIYILIYIYMKVAGKNIIQIGEYIMMWSRR